MGSSLLLDAIRRIVRASTQIAIWSIVVDPLDQQAVSFYVCHGFEPLIDTETLFLSMKDAIAWLEADQD